MMAENPWCYDIMMEKKALGSWSLHYTSLFVTGDCRECSPTTFVLCQNVIGKAGTPVANER